ncbi:MAG: ABC transporter ATP-binding protein [Candidatus Dadabacteria bacterium]|nr:ABC transporter ATP-binding protein [Candidatus Dadabacteria bacterium]
MDTANNNHVIEIIDVHKSFDSKHVHRGLNLSIKKGESITVLGGSGTGKSVLLKEITGLIRPDSGRLLIDGEDVVQMDETELIRIRKKMGMLFQGSALFDSLTVAGNIAYPLLEHTDYTQQRINEVVAMNLELVGLSGIEDIMPSELSGGMKKRVGLARAIAMNPEILLYDEPTTGLDPPNISRINKLIQDMQQKFGVTGVIITHDVKCAFVVSDRIAFLHDGQIIFVGTVEEAQNSDIEVLNDFIHAKLRDENNLLPRNPYPPI